MTAQAQHSRHQRRRAIAESLVHIGEDLEIEFAIDAKEAAHGVVEGPVIR